LRDVLPEIQRRGAQLAVVGSGQPQHARMFLEDAPLDARVLVDPALKAYAAAGLRRDLGATLHPKTLLNGIRALRGGFRQGATMGDPWQQGGVFVITPAAGALFTFVSQTAGDHADPADVLAALS